MATFLEDVTDLNFDAEVLGSSEPFLLDFSATWCAPCRALDPILQALAQQYEGQLRIGKIDIDSSPEVAGRLGVRGAPTLVLFHAGKEQARRLGFTNRAALIQLLRSVGVVDEGRPSASP
jgi:thioredoxin 1